MTYDPKTFDWHAAAIAAKADTTGTKQYPPIFHDTPMSGTYAFRPSKNEPPKPVFFWYSKADGSLLCRIDNAPVKYGLDIWPACSRYPIVRAVYDKVIETKVWPHEIRFEDDAGNVHSTLAPGPGHNSGATDNELSALKGEILEWAAKIKKSIPKGAPTNQVDADALTDMSTKLGELVSAAEARRKAITTPLYDAYKTENAKWYFIKPNETLVTNAKSLVQSYIKAENRRRQDEADNANKAAAEAAQKAAETGQAPSVEALMPVATPAPVRTGTRGRTLGERKVQSVEFTNFKEAAAFFANMENPPADFIEAVKLNAKKLLGVGVKVPGAKLTE